MRMTGMRIAAWLAFGAALAFAQQPANAPLNELHVLKVQGNVYMLVGAGGNITIQAGRNGVLIVDSGLAPYADRIFAEIKKISPDQPLRYIINTHVHVDHVGGNESLAKRGSTIAGGNVVGDIGGSAAEGATIIAHEEVLNRMSAAPAGNEAPVPFGALPTDTYVGAEKDLFFNGEGIEILHQPAAHTDGDSIVFFRRSDVVSTGDIFTPERYPAIDLTRGGNVQGMIDGLNLIIDLTIPAEKQEGGTMVIPGHGRLCDEADVVEYRDMLTIVRDRFQDMINKGMTLEQVKAAKPTEDYDPLYGGPNDHFIEAVYKSLKPSK
ncbi:MAG: MBL fold metallo-hydrolase [Bryobacteraceae bacterium]